MARLSISLLGSLTATLDGQPVISFEYNKVRALLVYLIVESESPHRREALAGLLWPDQSQKAALNSLRNALAKLRLAIGDKDITPPYLFITNDAIQFNRLSDHKLDVKRFTDLVEACKTHRHRRIESCPSCIERLNQAAGLYKGEFLKGFYLPDSDLFDDWTRIKGEKFSQLAMETLQQLATIYEWREDYDQSVIYARQQLELDPCREEAHVQAMRLLAAKGMRTEACAQYDKCKELLASELGVEPMEETTRLFEQIKYGTFEAASSLNKLHHNNLPTSTTSFVGRERELSEINALLEDPTCRLLTLVGPGGVGKTRLALAVAGKQMEFFTHGVCFVPLAALSSVEFIVPAILEALNLTPSSQGDLIEQLVSHLRDKDLFLVLDNFEHLVEGAGLVANILQKAPSVMVLVTSRQRLSLQAEWLFEVNGLHYPSGKAVQDLATYDAVQLFTQRLHQVKPRITIFQEDLPSVTRICQLVEGLPLGIELAASAVRLRSINQVATAIEDGKEDLAIAYKDVPVRHRSLRLVFEHSWRLLNEQERSVFSGLSVFRGGFTAEASQKVAEATPAILFALVEHSMVRYDPQQERYDLHELVRQYALEKLTSQGMEPTLRQRHLRYFTDLAEQADKCWIETHHLDLFVSHFAEIENFREALENSFTSTQMGQALQLAGGLGLFWSSMGYWKEGYTWLVKILGSGHAFPRDRQLARALMYAATLSQDESTGVELAEQALPIWRELGDQMRIAYALSDLGRFLGRLGDYGRAMRVIEESLQIYRKLDNQAFISRELIILSETYLNSDLQNKVGQVRTLLEQSQNISRQLGFNPLVAWSNYDLGLLDMNQGNFNRARILFEESLTKTRDIYLVMLIYNSLGLVCFYLQDNTAAHSYFEKGLMAARNTDLSYLPTLSHLSYLICCQGEFTKALYYLKEVFCKFDGKCNDLSVMILDGGLEHMSGVLIACGEAERATRMFAFSEAQREKLTSSFPLFIRPDYERDLAETRRQLGEDAFAKAWEEGRAMTLEQVKACALEAKVRITVDPKIDFPS